MTIRFPPNASVRAATEDEQHARNRLTAPVWGNRLSVDQYLERERRLRATAFSKRAMRTWVLARRDEILASCESYSMPSTLDRKRGATQGIASVFVEEPHRGNGYAAALLASLVHAFRGEHAQASILFSEVGTKLYGEVGYVARDMRARQWTPVAEEIAAVARPFSRSESDAVLGPLLLKEPPDERRFRIVPYQPQLEWHRERSAAYHAFLASTRRDPNEIAGAVAGNAWIAWTPDYRLDRLMVLTAQTGNETENAALVESLRRAAHALSMPIAEHWESPAIRLPGGNDVPRDDEVPMLCPIADFAPALWLDYSRACWV